MGAASCKNTKSPPPTTEPKNDNKNITIGVFGLDDAGKTSTVKAIEGNPTTDVTPTISSTTTMVKNFSNDQSDRTNKNSNQKNIKMIDLSGKRSFRQKSWSQYYDQIHGLIYVIDASERERLSENQETLEDLLENDKLKNKPILILANKQDERGAISNEYELKRQLEIDRLKIKYKIELCTALPQKNQSKVDDSIRKGFTWLIRTIEENYSELNARVMKTNNNPRITSRFNRSESDDDDKSDNRFSKNKNTDYRSKITSEKLPSINAHKNRTIYSDDEDDDDDRNYSSANRDFNKKRKVIGATNSNDKVVRRTNDNEPKGFRTTYESFPEETPWSSSTLRGTKSESTLPKLNTKSSITSDTRRRDVSPLVHDTKSYTNGSLSKRFNQSDDEDNYNRQPTSKTPSRFDNSTSSTSKLASNTNKKATSSIYDDDGDDYYNKNPNRGIITTANKSYNRYDDDYNDNKPYQRSTGQTNLNSEYRGTSAAKMTSHAKYNDDDDDDDDHRWSSSKPTPTTTTATRSTYNNNNDYSNTKPTNPRKFSDDDDDYRPSSSIKAVNRSNYTNHDDDDDDDYRNTTKKTNYSSSYGNGTTNTSSRFRKTTDYDS